MTTKPLKDPLPDEHILQVEPRPRPSVEADWRSRPNLYTGRALSAEALSAEQRERSGRLALRGQMVAPGVVAGLEVRLEEEVTATQELLYRFHISPGMGLTASGEDVCLSRPLRVPLRQIAVYRGDGKEFDLSVLYSKPDELPATHNNLQAAVLVLVPVVSKKAHTAESAQSVAIDPEDYAFEDQQLVDGCALVLFDWPQELMQLPSRETGPDHEKWRNRLAWEIFDREQERQPGQYAPWEKVGVPLALVGFEAPPQKNQPTPPIFVDRAAVVRSGGAPRARTPLIESRGSPLLWQARTLQFAEHLATLPSETIASASSAFDRFPPLGTLPKHAIDLFTWKHRFFPDSFILDAVPVPLEQLDAVAYASAALDPLRSWEQERVRVLVPIPDAHFEPHLLQEELLDPAFQTTIRDTLGRLSHWRQRRTYLRRKAIALLDTLEGAQENRYPTPDPSAIPGEEEGPGWNPKPGEEEDYDAAVSELEDVYEKWGQSGSWADPMNMGLSASKVATAVAQDGNDFGVVTQNDAGVLFGAAFKNKKWTQWAAPSALTPAHKDFRAVWRGGELTIVAVISKVTGETLEIYVCIGRLITHEDNSTEWSWEKSASHLQSQVTAHEILAFTAVSVGARHIDAFVAARTTVKNEPEPTIEHGPVPARTTTSDDGRVTIKITPDGTHTTVTTDTTPAADGTVTTTSLTITKKPDGTVITTDSTTSPPAADGTVTTKSLTTTEKPDGTVITTDSTTDTKPNRTVTTASDTTTKKSNTVLSTTHTDSTTLPPAANGSITTTSRTTEKPDGPVIITDSTTHPPAANGSVTTTSHAKTIPLGKEDTVLSRTDTHSITTTASDGTVVETRDTTTTADGTVVETHDIITTWLNGTVTKSRRSTTRPDGKTVIRSNSTTRANGKVLNSTTITQTESVIPSTTTPAESVVRSTTITDSTVTNPDGTTVETHEITTKIKDTVTTDVTAHTIALNGKRLTTISHGEGTTASMNGTATTFDPNTTPPTTLSTTNIHSTTKPDGTVTTTHTTSRNGNLLSTTTITITTESDNTVTTKSTTIAEPDGAVPRTTTIDTTTTKPDGSVLRIITIDSTRRSGSSVVRTLHKTTIHPDGSRVTTTADSATSYGILKFTWSVGSPSRSSVQELTDTKGKLVKRMVALTPPLPKQSQSAADDGLSGTRVDLLFLATDDLPIDSSRTPSPLRFHHLQGIHKSGEQNQDLMLPVNRVETTGITGDDLSACWSYDKQNKNYQLESLIIGADGIRHGRYIETWGFTSSKLNDKSADAILAASRTGDDRVHAVWRDKGEASPLKYRWIEGERWSDPIVLMENCPLSEGPQNFGVVINGTALIDLFLATPDGLHQLKLEADKTRALVNQKGLRRFISDSTELLERVDEFIHAGSSQVQADTQNVRQLMISGTTEASRLVVSPILGATMVQSPLAARSDIESFLSYFHRKREALLGLAASTPDEIDVLQDARETLEQATSTRRDLTERLIRFVEELGLDVTNMALLGIAVYSDGFERDLADGELSGAHRVLFETNTKIVTRESILVSDLVKDPFKLKTVLARIEQEPNALAKAIGNLGTLEWKASDYFSTSVQHLENALVLLQEMEGRMGPHHQSLDDYKRVHVGLERDWAALKKRLEAVERELAEARQDVTIARSLLAEEESRITGINQRRKQLFDQHVPFLVFQRPRECELTRETPSRELEPGRVKEFQPEVLASTAAAPPELLAYVELIRDSPLKGFTVTRKLLDGLDRLELIQRTFEWAQVRAVQRLPIHLPVLPSNPTSYAQGLFHLLSAREQLIAQQRGTFVHFSRAALYNRPLRELQQLAGELLSLGDLIDTAQGRPEVGQGAATELALIAKVATALYERFGQVLPVIRMEWAERMSQYDAPVNLHNLSRLPRWAEIDGTARREMQTLVDWLFQRVVPIQREAFYLMNDLVRTCMLLASHAPVNELLSGELSKTTMARVGGSLELKVTQMRVRIGMHVVVRTTEQTVQAVVVDLSSGLVRARVLSTSAAMVQLPEKTPAFFSEPARGTGTLLPYVGARR